MATGSEWVSELGQRDVRVVGCPQGVGGSGRGSGRRTTGSTLATGSEWGSVMAARTKWARQMVVKGLSVMVVWEW